MYGNGALMFPHAQEPNTYEELLGLEPTDHVFVGPNGYTMEVSKDGIHVSFTQGTVSQYCQITLIMNMFADLSRLRTILTGRLSDG